jgi:L-aspartate oxidase
VTFLENTCVLEAKKIGNAFAVTAVTGTAEAVCYAAQFLLLCTGGIGRVYRYTTNPPVSTGDGIRIAYELGAEIKHLSFVQFHPTAFAGNDEEQFLISESVRGEGAWLLNCKHTRFMQNYDERLELAPRDVVSKAILKEAHRTQSDKFYLDMRRKGADYLQNRFPAIYAACKQRGVDMAVDYIPIYPCQHYLMGGVNVDLHAQTNVSGLFAAGECAHTGLHGSNRLASNSLPEALVFSRRAAEDILTTRRIGDCPVSLCKINKYSVAPVRLDLAATRRKIQDTMQDAYFVEPKPERLPEAAAEMKTLYGQLQNSVGDAKILSECRSLACVAMLILQEAAERFAKQ